MNRVSSSRFTLVLLATYFVRVALAAGFLSAVADRLGWWGPPDAEGVVWGNLTNYQSYVAQLNWFVPSSLIPALGWFATIAETVIAIGLIIGWRLRWFSLAAGILLTTFAATMWFAFGPKPPLDYSVFAAAGAAYLLSAIDNAEAIHLRLSWCNVCKH